MWLNDEYYQHIRENIWYCPQKKKLFYFQITRHISKTGNMIIGRKEKFMKIIHDTLWNCDNCKNADNVLCKGCMVKDKSSIFLNYEFDNSIYKKKQWHHSIIGNMIIGRKEKI